MHLVLYRKYRPQNFSDIIGQNHIVEILKKAISLNRVGHSYLFAGPKGTGKTSLARILAKAVNCVNLQPPTSNLQPPFYEPCNECEICAEITNGNSLDLVEIDAASNRGINEIREIKETIRLHPFKSLYRIYIIDEVHMLTNEAFNAFLKILEEPPKFVIFILATTESDKIPETIISRCQEFKFRKVPEQLIRMSLKNILEKEKIKIEDGALELLSIISDGSLRDAHSLLEQIIDFESKEIKEIDARNFFGAPAPSLVNDFIFSIFDKKPEKSLEIISHISDRGIDSRLFAKLILRNLRLILLLTLAPNFENELKNGINEKQMNFLKELKIKTNVAEAESALKIFLDAYSSPSYSYLPELPLEIAVTKINQ